MDDTEVIQILKEISDDCFYTRHCSGCKFNKNSECILKGNPAEWDLESEEE